MRKAARHLKTFYPNLIHITCIAHAFHNACEELRIAFPLVNKIISQVKKVFRKSPKRVKAFKTKFPKVPLPPMPVKTRWGTWLEAAFYYCEHLDSVVEVMFLLDEKHFSVLKDINLKSYQFPGSQGF